MIVHADRLKITTGIRAETQESSFMNATLQSVGDLAVSVAIMLPDHANDFSQGQLVRMLEEDFKHLTDIGYEVEIQIGPDE
jgi:hypothetical protein